MERSTVENKDAIPDEINKFRKSLLLFSSESVIFSHIPQTAEDQLCRYIAVGV
jgi:hypothetical protein